MLNSSKIDNQSSDSEDRFPTDGLKSLLKNSDLLELLLKPLNNESKNDLVVANSPDTSLNFTNQSSSPSDLINNQLDLDISLLDESKSKSLIDWENSDEYFEMKINKAMSDGDNGSKIYGNAFLGPNLWDKNDLFQGEKFGVKFECLEIDEFLNENGLNETDAEFLDQLQKFENSTNNISSNNNNNNNNNSNSNSNNNNNTSSIAQTQQQQQQQTPNNSISPSSCKSSSPSSSPSINIQTSQNSIINGSNLNNLLHSSSSSSSSSISGASSPNSLNNQTQINRVNQNQINYQNSIKNQHESLIRNNLETDSKKSSFDWSISQNDSSIDSISDYDDYDPKMKKFTDEELKPQPVLRKSKKNEIMMTIMKEDNSSSSISSNQGFSSNFLDFNLGFNKHQFVPNELKDDKYWARRRKNNLAAKRSRDARRMKENQIALRASYLERENDFLRKQLEEFKRETKLLKTKLARYETVNSTNLDIQLENSIK